MKKTTKLDRATIRLINADVDQALQAVAKKYGVNLSLGSTRFSQQEMTTKVTFQLAGEKGESLADLNSVDLFLGPGTFGKVISLHGKLLRIDGFNRRGKSTPVLATCLGDGKRYRLSRETAKESQAVSADSVPTKGIRIPMDADARAGYEAERRVS